MENNVILSPVELSLFLDHVDIKGMADIADDVIFGARCTVWSFAVICPGVVIGNDCVIGSGVYIGRNTIIGNNVRIQDKAHITDHSLLENDVFIGAMVCTMNDRWPEVGNPHYVRESIRIGHGASIGCSAVLLPGITVGHHAVVGAGAIVAKSVAEYTVIRGDRARNTRPLRRLYEQKDIRRR